MTSSNRSLTDGDFARFVLSKLHLSDMYPRKLKTYCAQALPEYCKAFTHPDMSDDNYEMYEFIGDSVINHAIVKYVYEYYPNVDVANVQVLARLKIHMASKSFLYRLAVQEGFMDWVQCPDEEREKNRRALLEDVFEAFFGCTYTWINRFVKHGLGDTICYRILVSMFDKMELPSTYEDLVDSVTRLKELVDVHRERIVYTIRWNFDSTRRVHIATLSFGGRVYMFESYKKIDAQQSASKHLLALLSERGISRSYPAVYSILSQRRRLSDKPFEESILW